MSIIPATPRARYSSPANVVRGTPPTGSCPPRAYGIDSVTTARDERADPDKTSGFQGSLGDATANSVTAQSFWHVYLHMKSRKGQAGHAWLQCAISEFLCTANEFRYMAHSRRCTDTPWLYDAATIARRAAMAAHSSSAPIARIQTGESVPHRTLHKSAQLSTAGLDFDIKPASQIGGLN